MGQWLRGGGGSGRLINKTRPGRTRGNGVSHLKIRIGGQPSPAGQVPSNSLGIHDLVHGMHPTWLILLRGVEKSGGIVKASGMNCWVSLFSLVIEVVIDQKTDRQLSECDFEPLYPTYNASRARNESPRHPRPCHTFRGSTSKCVPRMPSANSHENNL